MEVSATKKNMSVKDNREWWWGVIYKCGQNAWDKRSDLVHWEDLEGSGGEGGGRGDRDGEHM